MKAEDLTIRKIFTDTKQYQVPFYQRVYVWTRSNQWEQLWEDIQAKAEDRLESGTSHPHFLGAVVLDPQSREDMTSVESIHIIDGQQRLTTMQYVLRALFMVLLEEGLDDLSKHALPLLRNPNPETMRDPKIEVFKIWPTFLDRENFKMAMASENHGDLMQRFPDSFTKHGTIRVRSAHPASLEAIWFFADKIACWMRQDTGYDMETRAKALLTSVFDDIMIVTITLGEKDDPQIIFETLNGRGAELHATDLIRNFIFMRADRGGEDSKVLYENKWKEFESGYWTADTRRGRITKPRIEWFIHSSLQARTQKEVDLGRLYFEYRQFALGAKPPINASDQLEFLSTYAVCYKELVDGNGDSPISHFGNNIEPFEVTTVHPLALYIATSGISNEEQSSMFDLIYSYIVRRAICGLTTKNYNHVFLSLLRQLSNSEVSVKTLKVAMGSGTGDNSRMPPDDEFEKCLTDSELYPGALDTVKMRAILIQLEKQLRNDLHAEVKFFSEKELSENPDIDHIMPQEWPRYWPLRDGKDISADELSRAIEQQRVGVVLSDIESEAVERSKKIPTLGNLTLLNLSVNRGAQNKPFSEKRGRLIKNTNLRLNVELLDENEWTDEAIKTRSRTLAKIALKIWRS